MQVVNFNYLGHWKVKTAVTHRNKSLDLKHGE